MKFRLSTPADRAVVESLWDYCFEPKEDPFFQWYFTKYYKPEQVLLGEEGGEVQCLTHLNPYTLRLRGRDVETSYVVGLATQPAARSSGAGGKLLAAALREMRQKGQYIQILMPSKAGFYQPYGYELYCHQWRETLSLDALRPLTEKNMRYKFVQSFQAWKDLKQVYDAYTKSLSGYAVRDEASWHSHIEAQLAEGNIVLCYDGEEPVGYAFYKLGDPIIYAGEFIYSSWKGKKGLLAYMYNHRSQGDVFQWNEGLQDQSYRFYPDGKKGHETIPFMTGRIVDVPHCLEAIPYAKTVRQEMVLHITDPLAEWNTGWWKLTVDNGCGKVEKTTCRQGVSMPIGSLGLLVWGAVQAKDLAFYDKLRGTKEELAALQEVFPPTSCFINEWY